MNRDTKIIIIILLAVCLALFLYKRSDFKRGPDDCVVAEMQKNHTDEAVAKQLCNERATQTTKQ